MFFRFSLSVFRFPLSAFRLQRALLPILYQGAKIQKSFTFYTLFSTFYYLCEKYNTNHYFFL